MMTGESINAADESIPFALPYQHLGHDERFRSRMFPAVAAVSLLVAVIRIGGALVTGQSWMGLFLTPLPHFADARYWYSFLHGPTTLLLGVSLLIPAIRLLLGHRSAFRWIRLNESVALVLYALMLILNSAANLQHGQLSRRTLDIHIATFIGSLQYLVFPLMVVLLFKTSPDRHDAISPNA